jgi:hypothetical protein
MESAYLALSRAIRSRAIENTSIWNTRVYRAQAPAKSARPYLVYLFSSGLKPQRTKATDAEFIVTLKSVANDVATSEAGAARIAELFDDLGQHQDATLDCGADWTLIHSQLQRYISLVENVDGSATQLYHDGAMFRFVLERKS